MGEFLKTRRNTFS
jgi:hypothetical protein